MTKRIVLCADDYGQDPLISQAIRVLIMNGRINAASCLSNSTYWPDHATWLQPFKDQADIGLHFNLTEGRALSPQYGKIYGEKLFPLTKLIRKAWLGQLDIEAIKAECNAQIDSFISAFGSEPKFIDGHQHVHQLPIIRNAVTDVYEQRLRSHKAYIRLVREKIYASDYIKNFKKIAIYMLGAKKMKALLERHDIPHNDTFSGMYTFTKAAKYPLLFRQFVQTVGNGGLIMCHPGLPADNAAEDRMAKARSAEYQYLISSQFLADCDEYDIVLSRFSRALS